MPGGSVMSGNISRYPNAPRRGVEVCWASWVSLRAFCLHPETSLGRHVSEMPSKNIFRILDLSIFIPLYSCFKITHTHGWWPPG